MEKGIIVKTGDSYSDNIYRFAKESDAIDFFRLLGKATRLNSDYIREVGYIFTDSPTKTEPILQHGQLTSAEEMEKLKEAERARYERENLEREAKEQAEKAKEEVKE